MFRRVVLLILLVIPIAIIIAMLFQSPVNEGLSYAYYLFGIPIIVVNMWEWMGYLIAG
jgi:preprotein translocase subunit SecG